MTKKANGFDKARFISFEGGDGAGKTTQIQLLNKKLLSSIGNIKITVVSDGSFTLPLSAVSINAPEEEIKKHLRKYHMPDDSIHRETNLVVIDVGDKRLLVDVGSGSRFIGNTGSLYMLNRDNTFWGCDSSWDYQSSAYFKDHLLLRFENFILAFT